MNITFDKSIEAVQTCDATFEQEFKDERYMPWRAYYLDYSSLYQCIHIISSPQTAAKRIELEWHKVQDFFTSKRGEIERRLAACHLLNKEDNGQLPEQVKIVQTDIHRLYHFSKLNHGAFLRLFMRYDTLFDSTLTIPGFEDLSVLLFEWIYEINSLLEHPHCKSPKGPVRKYWLHPDNLLEVMLYLSWRAGIQTGPASLLYPANDEELAIGALCMREIKTVYYDTPTFTSYSERIANDPKECLWRTRDYGQKDYVAIEKKCSGATSRAEKHLTHKSLGKIPQYSQESIFANKARKIDSRRWIKKNSSLSLQDKSPVLKTTQRRTMFQTDETTIYIDTDIVMMDPTSTTDLTFPYCLVQIMGKELAELHACPLLEPVYDFSVYLHGVGTLFSDKVHIYPQWLQSPLDDDLRRIPFRGDLLSAGEKKKRQHSLTINTATDSSNSAQSSTINTPWSSTTIATIITCPDDDKEVTSVYAQDTNKLLVPLLSHNSRRSSFRSFDTASSPLLSPARRSFDSYCTFDHPTSSRSDPSQCKNCVSRRSSTDYFCTPSRPLMSSEWDNYYSRPEPAKYRTTFFAVSCLGISFAASYLLYVVLMVF
ncbi:unnamed protein product [Rhizopus stolonifer]